MVLFNTSHFQTKGRHLYYPTMKDQCICMFGGFRVIVSINIFFHALSPDKARRAYLQCFCVFLLCQMNVSNTFPSEKRNKNAFYSKVRNSRYVDFPLYGSMVLFNPSHYQTKGRHLWFYSTPHITKLRVDTYGSIQHLTFPN